MIDWTDVIKTLIVAVVGGGGFIGVATIRETKQGKFLDNITKLIDNWQELAEERKARAQELKSDLDKRDHKIDALYKEKEILREELDFTRTENAIAKLLKCDRTSCIDRHPPFGQGYVFNKKEKKNDEDKPERDRPDKELRDSEA